MWLILPIQNDAKKPETLALGYSSESTQQELSNEYQHEMVYMGFKNLCVLVLLTKVASALEGLTMNTLLPFNVTKFEMIYILMSNMLKR